MRARGTLDSELQRRMIRSMEEAHKEAERIAEIAKGYAPRKTNELAESIEVSQIIEKGEGLWRIELRAKAPHAAAHERGSGIFAEARAGVAQKPYVIIPHKGAVLVMEWPEAPEPIKQVSSKFPTVFLGIVEHKGVKGSQYMRRALRENSSRLWSQIMVGLTE